MRRLSFRRAGFATAAVSAGLALAMFGPMSPAAFAQAEETSLPDAVSDPAALYAAGRYVEAGRAAARSQAADALALAAKAYAAAAILADDEDDARGWTEEARRQAEAALARDPGHVEGRLQLAVSLWLESRSQGGLEAYWRGLPQRGKALIASVVADHPDEAWGPALLGAWHFEALRRGGGWASRTLDASVVEGAEAFNRALTLDPRDPAIAAQCALAYLALDPVAYRDHAAVAIDRALAVPARDAFEAALQDRAREAKRLMDAGDEAALEIVLAKWVEG